MNNKRSLFIVSLLAAGAAGAADEGWKGEAELGVVLTSGNTETQSISGKAKVGHERRKWRHGATFEALNTKDEDTTTAERYTLTGQSAYKMTERQYLFGLITYDADRFSGFEYQLSEALGYGIKAIDRETLELGLEAGLGARQSKLEESGDTENEGIVRLAGHLAWQISGTSEFTQGLSSEIGEESTITRSVTALKSQVAGNLAMKISYSVKHVSDVPDDVRHTDQETAVTLVYSF